MTYAEILYLVSLVRWLPLVSISCFERNFGPFGSEKLTVLNDSFSDNEKSGINEAKIFHNSP
jgi:hypothetical protein